MSEENQIDKQESEKKRKRDSSKKITFIVLKGEDLSLIKASTKAFKVSLAWKELISAGKVDPETQRCFGAIKGHHDIIAKDELRKPSYRDLAEIVNKMNG